MKNSTTNYGTCSIAPTPILVSQDVSRNNYATISSGPYMTKYYDSKEYTTKSSLIKGLRANGFNDSETYNGQTWNYAGKQFKLTFSK